MFSFFYTIIMLPAVLAISNISALEYERHFHKMNKFLLLFSKVSTRYPKKILVICFLISIIAAAVTIGSVSRKASMSSPVEALRYE